MIKTRYWAAGIVLVLLLSAGAALWLGGRPAPGGTADIYQDGVCIRSIDLSAVSETEYYTVESAAGSNVVEIAPGRIRILEADCPDQVCVDSGWLSDSAAPIVCLPHKLVIRLVQNPLAAQIDGVVR